MNAAPGASSSKERVIFENSRSSLNFVIGFRLNRGGYKGVPHGVRGVPLLISRDVFSILSYSKIVQSINWRIRSTIFVFKVFLVFSYSKYFRIRSTELVYCTRPLPTVGQARTSWNWVLESLVTIANKQEILATTCLSISQQG